VLFITNLVQTHHFQYKFKHALILMINVLCIIQHYFCATIAQIKKTLEMLVYLTGNVDLICVVMVHKQIIWYVRYKVSIKLAQTITIVIKI